MTTPHSMTQQLKGVDRTASMTKKVAQRAANITLTLIGTHKPRRRSSRRSTRLISSAQAIKLRDDSQGRGLLQQRQGRQRQGDEARRCRHHRSRISRHLEINVRSKTIAALTVEATHQQRPARSREQRVNSQSHLLGRQLVSHSLCTARR